MDRKHTPDANCISPTRSQGLTLEVLMSCMHQTDDSLVSASRLTGDVVVVNQCDREDYREYPSRDGTVRMYSTTQRGLTRSRNMAIAKAKADICLLCDDDETFVENYREAICDAYRKIPQADVLIFKMVDRRRSFPDWKLRLYFPLTMRVGSWQISFRRDRILASGIRFDELMGAGSGNGAEEELKFLWDCQKAGLKIYYLPVEIASVAQIHSTWFHGHTQQYFEDRGSTTRYIMGPVLSHMYAVYYTLLKYGTCGDILSPWQAYQATLRGIRGNKLSKLAKAEQERRG